MPDRSAAPAECANCGAPIPPGAKACPECGADERTGWRENADTIYDGLDLPEEAWREDGDDAETATRSRQGARSPQVNGIAWYWWVVGVVLIAMLVLGALRFL